MQPTRRWIVSAISIFVFASGVLNIVSVFGFGSHWRVRLLEDVLPWSVLSVSRSLTLIAGIFLIFLARGLWRGKKRAMRLSLILLSFSLALHLLKGLDFEEAIVLLIPINLLFFFRGEFGVGSSTLKLFEAIRDSIVILSLLFAYSVFGFYVFQGQFQQRVTLERVIGDYEYSILGIGQDALIPRTRAAVWFEDSISFVGGMVVLFIFANLFTPVLHLGEVSKEDRSWVRDLVLRYGGNSVDYFALLSDKKYFFSQSRKSVVAYKVAAGTAVVLSGPIGASEDKKECLESFLGQMKQRGLACVIYDMNEEGRRLAEEVGLKVIKIGEQAVIRTNLFSLEGSQMAEVRQAVARVEREGVIFRVSNFAQLTLAVAGELDQLRREWLVKKKIPPLTFSSDFYPLPVESEAYILMAYSKEGKLLAALTFLPYKAGKGMVLDLMLRSEFAFNGLMEGAIAYAIDYFKSKGKEEVSLSMAFLANVGRESESGFISISTELVFRRFRALYRYQSLLAFKKKFDSTWESAYLAFEQENQLLRVALALLRVSLTSFTKR